MSESAIIEKQTESPFVSIPIADLFPSKTNPRKSFFSKSIDELATSIKRYGILSPILVRTRPDGRYEIIFGERRYRAAEKAELTEVLSRVVDYSDSQVLEVQVIENDQREDVHPYEQALGYKAILDQKIYTIEQLADKVGKSVETVSRRIRLSSLTEKAAQYCFEKNVPISSMEVAAALPEDVQLKALKDYWNDGWNRTSQGFRSHVNNNFTFTLTSAKWKLEDANLLKQAGSCTACPFNSTNQGDLFHELTADVNKRSLTKGICLKHDCYRQKNELFIASAIAGAIQKADKKGESLAKISSKFGDAPKGTISYSKYSFCNADRPGAQRGIVVDGADAGTVKYFRLDGVATGSGPNFAAPERPRSERLEELRMQRVNRSLRYSLFNAILYRFEQRIQNEVFFNKKAEGDDTANQLEVMRLCTISLTYNKSQISDGQAPKGLVHPGFDKGAQALGFDNHGTSDKRVLLANRVIKAPDDPWTLLKALFIISTEREIYVGDFTNQVAEPIVLDGVGKLLGLKRKDFMAEAEKLFPPKKTKEVKP